MLRRTLDNPCDRRRIEIIRGLLQLRRDGHFHALDVGNVIRVQFEPLGRWRIIGWGAAARMVETAAKAREATLGAERKPPASERTERALGGNKKTGS